jgi:hypothetical protein
MARRHRQREMRVKEKQRTMKNRPTNVALICGGALFAGTTVAMVAAVDDGPKGGPGAVPVKEFTQEAFREHTTAVAVVQQPIEESFKIFRDRSATPMPAKIAAQVGSPSRFGRNPNLARRIRTPTGDGWIIPGDGWLCIAMPDPVDGYGTSCLPTQIAAKQGLYVGLSGGKGIPAGMSAQVALVSDTMSNSIHAQNGVGVAGSPGVLTGLLKRGRNIITSSARARGL